VGWQAGDRVIVRLPDRDLPRGRGGGTRQVDVAGTVLEVDPAYPPGVSPAAPSHRWPGVVVRLDRTVNGADQCFATHAELRPEGPPPS
jgi:hypothetical protein